MAETQKTATEPAANSASAPRRGRTDWRKWFTPKWIAVLMALSVGLHLVGYWYYCRLADEVAEGRTPEITLGSFRFDDAENPDHSLRSAQFNLHVSLLREVEGTARGRLAARRFKVQQGVEELLRQAHAADFDDPNLSELKRLLQEQVNEAIGLRAVDEVIITDLEFERGPLESPLESSEKVARPPASEGPRSNVSQREVAPLPFAS